MHLFGFIIRIHYCSHSKLYVSYEVLLGYSPEVFCMYILSPLTVTKPKDETDSVYETTLFHYCHYIIIQKTANRTWKILH